MHVVDFTWFHEVTVGPYVRPQDLRVAAETWIKIVDNGSCCLFGGTPFHPMFSSGTWTAHGVLAWPLDLVGFAALIWILLAASPQLSIRWLLGSLQTFRVKQHSAWMLWIINCRSLMRGIVSVINVNIVASCTMFWMFIESKGRKKMPIEVVISNELHLFALFTYI